MEQNKQTRREQREEVIKQLYNMDISGDFSPEKTGYSFVDDALEGIVKHLEGIDEIISNNLKNWRLQRLGYVDRAILRFATYEMWLTDTYTEIVINEALNITRKYSDEGDDKAVHFNNKVLDNISHYLKKVE
jgi:N utilization substance protein B